MTLKTGTRLGPYEIVAPIGAGGMGEVYKATDTRLGRTVAVKVLPPHFADDPERKERFEREARVISQLNHPHICTLFDVGEQDGIDFLVMEYLEGESLADILKRGPLPFSKALEYGIQMAEGLERAHRAGIVHRDLKPGNVILTSTGVKLLDFGLAKLVEPQAADETSEVETREAELTKERTIVGTLPYMAPEQVEGKTVDHRADIWALGALLYELFTGEKAFRHESQAGLIHAILGVDPPPVSPPALGQIISACLTKSPNERLQNAHDLALQLRWVASASAPSAEKAPVPKRGVLVPLLALVVGAIAAWTLSRSGKEALRLPMHVTIDLPDDAPVFPTLASTVTVSPDGARLVYPSILERGSLMMRRVDDTTPSSIPNTEGGISPFFSPDGAWIGFWANGSLKKVPVEGGSAVTICRTAQLFGATWSENDTIYFASEGTSTILQVRAAGGEPRPFTELREGEVAHRWPSALPGTRGILLAVRSEGDADWNQARIDVQPLDSGERKSILEDGSSPRFVSPEYLVFTQSNSLLTTRFDLSELSVIGTPVTALESIRVNRTTGRSHFDVSEDGTLVYLLTDLAVQRTLVWVHRDGTVQPLNLPPRGFEFPRISPDGKHVALTIREEESQDVADVWVAALDRGTMTRLTFDSDEQESAIWRPGGKLTFGASRQSQFARETVEKAADGSGAETVLATTERHHHPGSWTPDGQTLVADEFGENWDIWVTSLADGSQRPFLQSPHVEWGARLSPDGRFLAYASDETGRIEVYVQAFPGPGGKWQVSTDSGEQPVWSWDGRELFFRNGESMFAVDFESEPTVRSGSPRLLFQGSYASMPWGSADYDVHPDGERFLMIQGADTTPTKLHLIVNWPDELKSSVSTHE